MPQAKRTRFEADRPPVASSIRRFVASQRNAPVPNEPTAKLINAYGKGNYENASLTGKPNKCPPSRFGSRVCGVAALPPSTSFLRAAILDASAG